MQEEILTFRKNHLFPVLKPGISDIVISSSKNDNSEHSAEFWLHGTYQIDEAYAKALNLKPLHKALVITWTSNGLHQTKNIVGNKVLFSDDEEIKQKKHIGYFNYYLNDWIDFGEVEKSIYFTVSLGKYISNTIQVEYMASI